MAMVLSEIENQLGAGHLVLRHSPIRSVVFVAIVLTWALYLGLHVVLRPAGILWLDAFGGLGAVALAHMGFVVVVQSVRGIPILQATEGGIAINSLWGPMFVRWGDTAEFSAGNFRWLRIRLREGARPVASTWTRFANASLWASRTIAVTAFTTVAHPTAIAEGLSTLHARYCAT
jgi:hypothetical protein